MGKHTTRIVVFGSFAAILITLAAPTKAAAQEAARPAAEPGFMEGFDLGHPFVGIAGGPTLLQDVSVNPVDGPYGPGPAKERYNLGYIGAGAVGYAFSNGLQVDVLGAYEHNSLNNLVPVPVPGKQTGFQESTGAFLETAYAFKMTDFGSGTAIVDDGAIVAQSGTLTLAAPISGTASGVLPIDGGAVLVADSSVSGVQLQFNGPANLILKDPTAVTSTISFFGTGDVIDVSGLNANTLTYSGGTLTLEHGSTVLDTLSIAGSYTAADFTLAPDGHGGTDISFAAGASEPASASDLWHETASGPQFLSWLVPPHVA
jgi:hypothetical protein